MLRTFTQIITAHCIRLLTMSLAALPFYGYSQPGDISTICNDWLYMIPRWPKATTAAKRQKTSKNFKICKSMYFTTFGGGQKTMVKHVRFETRRAHVGTPPVFCTFAR